MHSDKIDRKNSIGVAFSGGGLQGIAHIGAVQALYELGIHPQYVSGTKSSGAAMAAIVAMGCDSDEMKRVAKKALENSCRNRQRPYFQIACTAYSK